MDGRDVIIPDKMGSVLSGLHTLLLSGAAISAGGSAAIVCCATITAG